MITMYIFAYVFALWFLPYPELGRFFGERISYPLQYYCVVLVAQLVKNPSAMRRPGFDTWARNIPWRRERLPTPVFWLGESHGLYTIWVAISQTWLSHFHFSFLPYNCVIFILLNKWTQSFQIRLIPLNVLSFFSYSIAFPGYWTLCYVFPLLDPLGLPFSCLLV